MYNCSTVKTLFHTWPPGWRVMWSECRQPLDLTLQCCWWREWWQERWMMGVSRGQVMEQVGGGWMWWLWWKTKQARETTHRRSNVIYLEFMTDCYENNSLFSTWKKQYIIFRILETVVTCGAQFLSLRLPQHLPRGMNSWVIFHCLITTQARVNWILPSRKIILFFCWSIV